MLISRFFITWSSWSFKKYLKSKS